MFPADHHPSITPLHPVTCQGTSDDLTRMAGMVDRDPGSLERALNFQDPENPGEEDSMTTLQVAIKLEHLECVKMLIARGANPRRHYGFAGDAVSSAIEFNSVPILAVLVSEHGMRPSSSREDYISCEPPAMYVCHAARSGSPQALELLLNHGGETECREFLTDLQGFQVFPTPSVTAVMYDRPENLKVLLLHGAITDFSSEPGFESMDGPSLQRLSLSLHLGVAMRRSFPLRIASLRVMHQFGVLRPAGLTEFLLGDEAHRAAVRELLGVRPSDEWDSKHRRVLAKQAQFLVSEPRSLKSLCRLSLRGAIGKERYSHVVQTMGEQLPRELLHYLLFSDCDDVISEIMKHAVLPQIQNLHV